jgi:plasmid stability protein
MATIVIRKLDETVKRKLQVRAAMNGRSMEAEAREVLAESLGNRSRSAEEKRKGPALKKISGVKEEGLGTALHKLFSPLGGVELKIPPRTFSNRPLPSFDE